MIKPFLNSRYISLFVIIFFLTTKVNSTVLVGTTPFITTWKTDNYSKSYINQITIPTLPGKTYNNIVRRDNDTLPTVEKVGVARKTLVPNCTKLLRPLDTDTNVPVNTDLTWGSVPNVIGYKLTIGTIFGVADILNAFDVGNTTTYSLSGNFPGNSSIFVTITPYNADGDAIACAEEEFMTGSSALAPNCTTLSIPMDGDNDVSFNTDLTWLTVSNATGYKLTVGTTSGGTDVLNAFDVGNTNSYNLPSNLPGNTRIFVDITPYNSHGNTINCTEESFTTGAIIPVPKCTNLLMPLAGAYEVPVGTDLLWKPVPEATGYILTLETFTDNIDVYNRFDVGNITSYNIPGDLPENTRVYVVIEPYNAAGEAVGCIEEIFTTGKAGIHIPPKFFTPNNDGVNDFWITPNPINRISSVNIYNRYGKLLQKLNNIARGWDGTYNGYALPTDDYWYQIVYNDGTTFQGHISLKR